MIMKDIEIVDSITSPLIQYNGQLSYNFSADIENKKFAQNIFDLNEYEWNFLCEIARSGQKVVINKTGAFVNGERLHEWKDILALDEMYADSMETEREHRARYNE
jgi:hypothetical protein